jgi:protein-S-isoprenylcysteine O-methyltransferase Ste14
MNYTSILAFMVIIMHILRLIYLFFEPKFLNHKIFHPPMSKLGYAIYYSALIVLLLAFEIHKLGIAKIFVD